MYGKAFTYHNTAMDFNHVWVIWRLASSPFYQHGITLIPVLISNYIQHKVWDELTYSFPIFNAAAVVIWK